ncbi:MAG: hypothetical protein MUO76_09425 [Anaerolineaceae bacterium]|nr:hypothetical protein [Anaerolineaceae bacterium]
MIVLVVIVLSMAILAWVTPDASNVFAQNTTDTLENVELTATPIPILATEESQSISSEEVGYMDGVIFCGTILVLMLFLGTLREILWYRKKTQP